MILEEIFYAVQCDNCGKVCECNDTLFWDDKSQALCVAQDSDWEVIDGDNICPDCYTYDDDDNLIINTN